MAVLPATRLPHLSIDGPSRRHTHHLGERQTGPFVERWDRWTDGGPACGGEKRGDERERGGKETQLSLLKITSPRLSIDWTELGPKRNVLRWSTTETMVGTFYADVLWLRVLRRDGRWGGSVEACLLADGPILTVICGCIVHGSPNYEPMCRQISPLVLTLMP